MRQVAVNMFSVLVGLCVPLITHGYSETPFVNGKVGDKKTHPGWIVRTGDDAMPYLIVVTLGCNSGHTAFFATASPDIAFDGLLGNPVIITAEIVEKQERKETHPFIKLKIIRVQLTGATDQPGKDKIRKKAAAEPYDGFKTDQALLRKHLIHKGKNGGKDTKASSAEACEAAERIFSRIPFLYRTRDEVLALLGDPATISDYNRPAGKDPTCPLVYVFDSGFGGYRYTIRFGGLLDGGRVRAVEVEGQN